MKVFLQTTLFVVALLGITIQPDTQISLGKMAYAFHFPWDQGHDTFTPEEPPEDPDDCDKCNAKGSPFVVATGAYTISEQDYFIPSRNIETTIDLTRVYHGRDRHNGLFGRGWTFTYGVKLIEVSDGVSRSIIVRRMNGQRDRFIALQDGSFQAPPDVFEKLEQDANGFRLVSFDGITQQFDVNGNLISKSDQNGNKLSITYDSLGFVSSIIDDSNRIMSFIKGPNGKVKTIVDPANRMRHYEYDQVGNLISVTDPSGGVTQYDYDSRNRLTTITDPRNFIAATVTYDSLDRVATYSEYGNTYVLTYFDNQKIVTERDQSGKVRTLTYNENINVTQITNPQGNSELIEYNQSFLPLKIVDESGKATSLEYDAIGNISSITDPLGNRVMYSYDPIFQQLKSITDQRGNVTSFQYNNFGDLVSETDALGNESKHEYNTLGQLTKTTNALGHVTEFSYDQYGNENKIVDPLNNSAIIEYDILGNTISGVDVQGTKTVYEYDKSNRLIAEVDALGNSALSDYDANGNLILFVNRNGGRFTFEYDGFNRLITESDPLGRITRFTYDSEGNLKARIDAKGQTIFFQYDQIGRLIEKKSSGNITNFTYDSSGKLLSVIDNDSSIQFIWDATGRLESTTNSVTGLTSKKINYAYDAAGNRIAMVGPNGSTSTYQFDPLNRLTEVKNSYGETFRYTYDEISRLISLERANGTQIDYAWDSDNRLISIKDMSGSIALQDEVYSYDNVGNRIQRQTSDGISGYEYDEIYRLSAVNYPASLGLQDENYSYDKIGNRLSSHKSLPNTYDIGMQLTEDSEFEYSYDENGNLISKLNKQTGNTSTYHWDAEDQLVQVDLPSGLVITFQYDGLGRRNAKSSNAQKTFYLYDGHNLYQEYKEDGTLSAQYTFSNRIDDPLSIHIGNQSYFYHSDSMRTVIALSDTSSNLVKSYQYDSFGSLKNESGNVKNTILFTAREWDSEIGLYYYRTRYYDPSLGRYISRSVHIKPDPFVATSKSNDASKLVETEESDFDIAVLERVLEVGLAIPLRAPSVYAYAFNNPITVADPTGENPALLRALAVAGAFVVKFGKQALKFCKKVRCKVELHSAHHKFGWPHNQKMKHVHAICWIKGKKGSAKRIQIPYAK